MSRMKNASMTMETAVSRTLSVSNAGRHRYIGTPGGADRDRPVSNGTAYTANVIMAVSIVNHTVTNGESGANITGLSQV